jgi:hypothetical protein
MSRVFTTYIEFDPDSSLYLGMAPGLPEHIVRAQHSTSCGGVFEK